MQQLAVLLLAFFVAVIIPRYTAAQSVIKGRVMTPEGEAIIGASIVLSNGTEYGVAGFSISRDSGTYRIEHALEADSFRLTLSHLTFGIHQRVIGQAQSEVNWVITPKAMDLPTLEVKQKAVVRRGDTLVFDVNQLREVNDESLEQLLARIPGMTVAPNGQIRYNDLPISRFYIEGLDLLEGRYALATRNLRIDAVRDIEVLEAHQHIRALDSLVRPPNAAINLRLKSSITFTGKAEAGAGLSPALYHAVLTLFGFQKQQQFSLIGTADKTGRSQRDNFLDFSLNAVMPQPKLIQAILMQPPLEAEVLNTRDNREQTGGLNLLRKLNDYDQFKLQLSATNDRVLFNGNRRSVLRDGDNTTVFEEQLAAQQQLGNANGRLIWEHNAPKTYFKTQVEGDYRLENTLADNLINQASIQETLRTPSVLLKGQTDAIFRRGDRAYRLWARATYQDDTYDLSVLPLPLTVINPGGTAELDAIQTARQRVLRTEVYSRFYKRWKKVKVNYQAGLKTEWKRLDSDLREIQESNTQSFGPEYENAVQRSTLMPYLKQEYETKLGKFNFELEVPASIHFLRTRELRGGANRRNDVIFVAAPDASIGKTFKSGDAFSIGLRYQLDYDQEQPFYPNLLLRNSRSAQGGTLLPNRWQQLGGYLNYRSNNPFTGRSVSSYLQYGRTKADLLTATSFDEAGSVAIILMTENVRQYLTFSNRLESGLGSWGQLELTANYSGYRSPSLLNGENLVIQQNNYAFTSSLSWIFGQNVLKFAPQSELVVNSISASNLWQSAAKLVYFRQLPKNWGKLNFSWAGYRTQIGPRRIYNQLFNAWYKTKIPRWKLNVALHLTNLTNAVNFVSFQQFGFSEEVALFRLRPRQLLLVVGREF